MKVLKKILAVAAVSAAAFGVQWGTANAAPLSYSDTSVQVLPGQHVDAITDFTAKLGSTVLNGTAQNVPVTVATTASVTASGTGLGSLTYSIVSGANPVSGLALAIDNSGSITAHVTGQFPATAPTSVPPIVVKATDGTAVGFETLNLVPVVVSNSVHSVDASAVADTVTTIGANNNVTGHVDFTPASATYTLANAPAGTALAGSSLVASTSVPGIYDHLVVTAADTMGAAATDTLNAVIKGHLVIVPPPAPTTPFVYHGHVLTADSGNATVGWSDGIPDNATAWGSGMVNGHVNHCVEVFVYGFDRPAGTAHVGFTCDNGNPAANVGYLSGLSRGHTYALFVQPATGTYGNNHPIPGTNPQAHITVITPA